MKLKVKEQFAGRSSNCPTCKHPLTVPTPETTNTGVPQEQIEDAPSRIAQAGLEGRMTLGQPPRAGQKPVEELIARRGKGKQRYVIEGEIARGGMGAVLRAVDCDIRREVAVKFLLDKSDPTKKLRFIEEAQITGQLEHPNIVPIHDLGADNQGGLYFTMKMVQGRSLAQIVEGLRQHPKTAEKEWPLSRLLTIFVNVCNALAYAHSHNVIHRDLKPANIMIGDFGEVYVMDWGLAKVRRPDDPLWAKAATEAPSGAAASGSGTAPQTKVATSRDVDADLTQDGAILGTPVYMPPEQALGEIAQIDQRSDIYSLGAILYELLTLQPPVEKEGGYLAILARVAEGAIQRPEQRVPERAGRIPRELSAVTMKALARRKEDRYLTVERLRRDIERFQEGRSVSAREDSFGEAAWKLVKRNKGVSAATAAALVVISLIVGFGYQYNYEARLKAEQATADFLREQGEKQARTRNAVPALIRSARQVGLDGPLDDALKQVDVALAYEQDNVEARLLKGQLLLAQKDWTGGREELQRYLQHQPKDADARKLVELCAPGKKQDTLFLVAVAEVLQRQNANTLAARLLAEVRRAVEARKPLLEAYRKQINAAWPGLGRGLYLAENGEFQLFLTNYKQVAALEPLQGMQLAQLSLAGCSNIKDLTPLQGMPLTQLDISSCPVQDLTPLKGMPLTELNIASTKVQDLTPLQGMKLASLNLHQCKGVKNLTPLRGMPLTDLSLQGTAVKDLAALEGMPLTTLDISFCAAVHDLMPLKDMPLTTVYLRLCPQIRDLTALQGKKLTKLDLRGIPVGDLKPLQGMKLTELILEACPVRDLTPLKDMPLTALSLYNCGMVKDLKPLKDMPLIKLELALCGPVADLTPLQGMSLIEVSLTPRFITKGMEVLRQMKSLKAIGTGLGNKLPPEEFWKRYGAGEFK
jgi:serine/threonine protein kinase